MKPLLLALMALIFLNGCEKPGESEAEATIRTRRLELKADYEVKLTLHKFAVLRLEQDLHALNQNVTEVGVTAMERRVKEVKREGEEVQRAYDRAVRAGVVFEKR